MTITIPKPNIRTRAVDQQRHDEAIASGLDPVLARILASRPFMPDISPQDSLSPKLKALTDPFLLPDMEKAANRLVKALENQEIIGIETDHDCDGQTSHAVIYTALTQFFGHPPSLVRSYIGHRLNEGYGLSQALASRILADHPCATLIITADNGSSDEAQIALLRQANIDVIVTDHHEIPIEGIPPSAYAVVSPLRPDSTYPDRSIAGCMVAWLLMAATRNLLHKQIPSLATLLDFVAVGTVADCVSMAKSVNNRAVVSYGMKLIQRGTRSCWRAILSKLNQPLSSEDLGFKIGPLLNSDGRLSCAFGSVSFLLAGDDASARQWIAHLEEQNAERKAIQERITQQALQQAQQQCDQNKLSLCLFLEEGHAGVHGISASRIKDWYGRPVVILCPKKDDPMILTGSARSITGIHLRQVLQAIHDEAPSLLVRFGGHQGAAGLTIVREKLAEFSECFERIIQRQGSPELFGPILWTDGELPLEKIQLNYIEELVGKLEPFGREFEPPLFEAKGRVVSLKGMGQNQTHARLGLSLEDLWVEAVWFNAREHDQPWPVAAGDEVHVVYSPKINVFRGDKKLSCQIVYLERI